MSRDYRDEPEELEEWMNVWQTNAAPIEHLREDFISRTNKTRTTSAAAIAFLIFSGLLVLVAAIIAPKPPVVAAAILSTPAVAYTVARLLRWRAMFKLAPPLTPKGYLTTMQLHLRLEREQHAWDQRLWPVIVIVPFGIILWALYSTGFKPWMIALALGAGIPAYSVGFYESFVRQPRALDAEEQRLRELEEELDL